jgi:hypothetical protein
LVGVIVDVEIVDIDDDDRDEKGEDDGGRRDGSSPYLLAVDHGFEEEFFCKSPTPVS